MKKKCRTWSSLIAAAADLQRLTKNVVDVVHGVNVVNVDVVFIVDAFFSRLNLYFKTYGRWRKEPGMRKWFRFKMFFSPTWKIFNWKFNELQRQQDLNQRNNPIWSLSGKDGFRPKNLDQIGSNHLFPSIHLMGVGSSIRGLEGPKVESFKNVPPSKSLNTKIWGNLRLSLEAV